MQKAFIFDLDGVLIDDEATWETAKQDLFDKLFGKAVHQQLGSTLGVNMDVIYERAVAAGATVHKEAFVDAFSHMADGIYRTAPITKGAEELVGLLADLG